VVRFFKKEITWFLRIRTACGSRAFRVADQPVLTVWNRQPANVFKGKSLPVYRLILKNRLFSLLLPARRSCNAASVNANCSVWVSRRYKSLLLHATVRSAQRVLAIWQGRLSARPPVCHTLAPYQNGAS